MDITHSGTILRSTRLWWFFVFAVLTVGRCLAEPIRTTGSNEQPPERSTLLSQVECWSSEGSGSAKFHPTAASLEDAVRQFRVLFEFCSLLDQRAFSEEFLTKSLGSMNIRQSRSDFRVLGEIRRFKWERDEPPSFYGYFSYDIENDKTWKADLTLMNRDGRTGLDFNEVVAILGANWTHQEAGRPPNFGSGDFASPTHPKGYKRIQYVSAGTFSKKRMTASFGFNGSLKQLSITEERNRHGEAWRSEGCVAD